MKDENSLFETSDLGLAAFLFAKDFTLLFLRSVENSRRVIFVFQDSSTLQKTVHNYWTDTETVSPLKFYNAERELKRRLYSGSYERRNT